MCCGRPDEVKSVSGAYDAKMPDGTVVSVMSSAQEKAERDKVYAAMRSAASKVGYTVTR
jgi:hypothetical protein